MCYWCKIDITGNCVCLIQDFYYLSTQHTTTPRWAAASLPPAALPSIANPTSATPINHCTTASYGPWHAPRAGLTLAVCCSLVCGINIKHIKNREMSRSMAFGGRRLGMKHKNRPTVSGSRNTAVEEEVRQGWRCGVDILALIWAMIWATKAYQNIIHLTSLDGRQPTIYDTTTNQK